MTGTSGTVGSRGGRPGDVVCNSGKGIYSGSGSGSGVSSTSSTSSCPSEAGGGYRTSERSASIRAGEPQLNGQDDPSIVAFKS